jgi:hypothetical protein
VHRLPRDVLPPDAPDAAAAIAAEALRWDLPPPSPAELDAYLGGKPTTTERLAALILRRRGAR